MSTCTYFLAPTATQRFRAREATVDLEAIPSAVWGGLGAGSMLSLLYWLLSTGRIIQARVVDKMLADKDAQITRLWATVDSQNESLKKYAVSAETAAYALHEVEKQAAKAGEQS